VLVPDGDAEGDGLGGADPTVGEALGLGFGLGDTACGDRLGLGRPVRLGAGLVRCGCGWMGWTWPGVGDVAAAGTSAAPGAFTVDAGRTSR
jgi:hypothetical protein